MEVSRSKIAWAAGGFLVGMLLLLFGGGYVQYTLGMWGLVITELGILVFAIVSALVSRLDLRAVFRIRRGRAWQWRGCLYIYLGTFFITYACSMVLSALFPQMTEVSESLTGFITSGPYIFALIAVSILPGICEEAWHRGTLLSSLGSLKSIVLRVVIMGLVFGLFHLDLFRFLPTMVLGMGLSYMRIKTDNMLMPMTFHAVNNLIPISISFLLLPLAQTMEAQTVGGTDPVLGTATVIAFTTFSLASGILFIHLGRRRLSDRPQAGAPRQASTLQPPPPSTPPLTISSSASVLVPMTNEQVAEYHAAEQRARRTTVIIVVVCCSVVLLSCLACFGVALLEAVDVLQTSA
ncbi:MAG: CPBP family intramembrane metalloprotease [Coriobacteriales bacterium]|jgi:membrane protease YdiL (CAAX protease family)|nr:CPBP family intramembrane metalloprotease [Coriobacteriales bacterium]